MILAGVLNLLVKCKTYLDKIYKCTKIVGELRLSKLAMHLNVL